jgi:hypothetical protein
MTKGNKIHFTILLLCLHLFLNLVAISTYAISKFSITESMGNFTESMGNVHNHWEMLTNQ